MKNMSTKGNDSGLKHRWPRNTDQHCLGKGRRYCVQCPRTSRYRIKQNSFSNKHSGSKPH